MTEEEWTTGVNTDSLLQHLRTKVSYRKLRLFACACCRRLAHISVAARYHRMIDKTEAYADGELSERGFVSAFPAEPPRGRQGRPTAGDVARAAISALNWPNNEQARWEMNADTGELVRGRWAPGEYAEHFASRVCLHAAHAEAIASAGVPTDSVEGARDFLWVMNAATAQHAALFRDVVGNPFRPVAFAPAWRTGAAVGLAQSMYEVRDFAAMPVLADALEEAGCDNPDVLAHCRGPGPHVRGCWVVDLVLGKA